ncbi:transmembrane protein 267-like, partial [Pollicipes pollicipes]|uniref:transmembrane protein 267-like n=1 Tax=Pollicipes pollicipes TaxID=41117 RepID=UPI00188513B3
MMSLCWDTPLVPLMLTLMTCALGDLALRLTAAAGPCWPRAVLDSATHGVVALLSWAAVSWPAVSWRLAAAAGIVGAGIDLDHVLMAGSLDIHDVVNLPTRPPLHATTPWLMLAAPLAAGARTSWRTAAALLLTAALSHHVRDAERRGLWLWPLGSTPPLPTAL